MKRYCFYNGTTTLYINSQSFEHSFIEIIKLAKNPSH